MTAAWQVAVRLRDELRAAGYVVRMTKSAERQVVRNVERARIANEAGAALMVRLHCDVGNRTGFAVYSPNRQGTAHGRKNLGRGDARSRAVALALDQRAGGRTVRLAP